MFVIVFRTPGDYFPIDVTLKCAFKHLKTNNSTIKKATKILQLCFQNLQINLQINQKTIKKDS